MIIEEAKRIPCSIDCGEEAACIVHPNNTLGCICPHDSSIPSADFKCPRVVVAIEPSIIMFGLPISHRPATKLKPTSASSTTAIPPQPQHYATTPQSQLQSMLAVTTTATTTPTTNASMTVMAAASTNITMVGLTYTNIYLAAAIFLLFIMLVVFAIIALHFHRKYYPETEPQRRRRVQVHDAEEEELSEMIQLNETHLTNDWRRYVSNPIYNALYNRRSVNIVIYPPDAITELVEISEGNFGTVYRGKLHTTSDDGMVTESTVAVKTLKVPVRTKEFTREVNTISYFKHPNILTLLGICPSGTKGDNSPMMIFEYMPLGDLRALLVKSSCHENSLNTEFPVLTEKSYLSIASQIAQGMKFLADNRVIHRDLACRNCLVGPSPNMTIKIGDFGMSRDIYCSDYYKADGRRSLPIRWMAPESLMYGYFTYQSDIWSYGVVLWEIYTGGMVPYYGFPNKEVIDMIKRGIRLNIPCAIRPEISRIMRGCWSSKDDRLTFSDICNNLLQLQDNQTNLSNNIYYAELITEPVPLSIAGPSNLSVSEFPRPLNKAVPMTDAEKKTPIKLEPIAEPGRLSMAGSSKNFFTSELPRPPSKAVPMILTKTGKKTPIMINSDLVEKLKIGAVEKQLLDVGKLKIGSVENLKIDVEKVDDANHR